jgi:hypothetical protein
MKKSVNADKAPDRPPHEYKIYRFGFWLFFFLAIFSVVFSVWAITSIYANFTVVTKILDESFERTNFVLDITSSKMIGCEQKVRDCQSTIQQKLPG